MRRPPTRRNNDTNRPGGRRFSTSTTERDSAEKPAAASMGWRMLLLVVATLAVFIIVFSPLRNLMSQREAAHRLDLQVQAAEQYNAELKKQLEMWEYPDYVAREARSRLGYVRPGETTYVVVDKKIEADEKKAAQAAQPRSSSDLPWFYAIYSASQEIGKRAPVPPQVEPSKKATPTPSGTPVKTPVKPITPTPQEPNQ